MILCLGRVSRQAYTASLHIWFSDWPRTHKENALSMHPIYLSVDIKMYLITEVPLPVFFLTVSLHTLLPAGLTAHLAFGLSSCTSICPSLFHTVLCCECQLDSGSPQCGSLRITSRALILREAQRSFFVLSEKPPEPPSAAPLFSAES